MKYGKDLISRGGSTTRTPAMTAVSFANLRGTVRIKSVCAMAKIAGTKNGKVNATRRFAPSCDRARSTKACCPFRSLDQDVLKFQILFQRKTTSTNPQSRADETNKIQGKEHFGLQGRGRFFWAKKRIDSSRRDILISLSSRRGHFQPYVSRRLPHTRQERWQHNHRGMVAHSHAHFLASGRIEFFSSDHLLKPGHERLQLSPHMFSPYRALITAAVTNKEWVSERIA